MAFLYGYSPKKIYLRWKVNQDEVFLIKEGLRIAHENGLEINVATEYILIPSETKKQIYFPPQKGGIDVTPLIQLGAEKYPERAERWLKNREKLTQCS